jgi:ABC-2 type transport system ATP-binding protein
MNEFAIVANGLSKSYKDFVALDSLNLKVRRGEIFGLLGHNGAGKTTTVNLLTTLLAPTAGTVEIEGVDTAASANEVRKMIGYLPENVQLYNNMTTLENLRFFASLSGLKKPDARIREVLDYLEFRNNDNKRIGTFSKGMRQRVGIAQAILHKPSVLFLDEPTSGLDPEGVRQLRDVIIRLNADLGVTIFMNTHLLSEVTKTCSSIGILKSGKMAYQNSVDSTIAEFPDQDSLEEIYLSIEKAE